jgi:hypothetical protein
LSYTFPYTELSPAEKLWLAEAYTRFKRGEEPNLREMKLSLWNRMPHGFDPQAIDHHLLRFGHQITLLGIWHVAPRSRLFQNTDRVIRGIRDLLIADHKKEEFTASEIAAVTGVTANEVSRIFDILLDIGDFWTSRGGEGKDRYIRVSELRNVDAYLNYSDLETAVRTAFNKHKQDNSYYSILSGQQDPLTTESKSHPIFRSKVAQIDRNLCFVLMPFNEEWSTRVYFKLIRQTLEELGIQCLRADDLYGQIIIEDIWVKINQCAFVIVDVTTRNPNVMYELGIVHTIGKPAILITQDISQIPFDFTHHRHLIYEDNVDGFTKLKEQLPTAIREIYKENYPEYVNQLSLT